VEIAAKVNGLYAFEPSIFIRLRAYRRVRFDMHIDLGGLNKEQETRNI